jgi:hypothetical protein
MLGAYGIDTLDPAVSTRRVWVLLQRLPPEARRPGEAWSTEAELLATLIDHVAELTWLTHRVNGGKGARPKPVPRPPARPVLQVDWGDNAPGGRAHSGGPSGETGTKHNSWAEAIMAIAKMPGVTGGSLCPRTDAWKSPSRGIPAS